MSFWMISFLRSIRWFHCILQLSCRRFFKVIHHLYGLEVSITFLLLQSLLWLGRWIQFNVLQHTFDEIFCWMILFIRWFVFLSFSCFVRYKVDFVMSCSFYHNIILLIFCQIANLFQENVYFVEIMYSQHIKK